MMTDDYFRSLPPVLKVKELTPILSIGQAAVYALVRSGQIKCFRVGKQYRIPKESVIDFLHKCS